jgi:hypothetical protein
MTALEHLGVKHPERSIPWYFPTVEDYRAGLVRVGFTVEHIALIPRPTPLPTGMRGWLETFAILSQAWSLTRPRSVSGRRGGTPSPGAVRRQGNWTADYGGSGSRRETFSYD